MGLLEKLKEDPNVLYIYETGLQIYGLFEGIPNRKFTIICTHNYSPDGFVNDEAVDESDVFEKFDITHWFNLVENESILAWECACLPKKFIHKEYVKLLLKTDPLKLRKIYEVEKKICLFGYDEYLEADAIISAQKELFYLFKLVKLSNQIIENHKIVNFKTLANDYRHIVTGEKYDLEYFNAYINDELLQFKRFTDDILKRDKIQKILQNERNANT